MKCLNKRLEDLFEKIGCQDGEVDPIFIARFYIPGTRVEWFVSEYDKKDNVFFGYASLFKDHNDEWGYISIEELENPGLNVMRDDTFEPSQSSVVISKIKNGMVKQLYGI